MFDLPRTLVNRLIGWLPGGWCQQLRDILYYETMLPTALWTSWWYHEGWFSNPLASIRIIRNWTTFEQSYIYTINGNALSYGEWIIVGLAELMKLSLAGLWPAGRLWTSLYRLVDSFELASYLPVALNLPAIAAWLDWVDGQYPAAARVIGNSFGNDVNSRLRALVPGRVGGFIPSVGELAVAAPLLGGANAAREL